MTNSDCFNRQDPFCIDWSFCHLESFRRGDHTRHAKPFSIARWPTRLENASGLIVGTIRRWIDCQIPQSRQNYLEWSSGLKNSTLKTKCSTRRIYVTNFVQHLLSYGCVMLVMFSSLVKTAEKLVGFWPLSCNRESIITSRPTLEII